jgi:hypothetical protein
MASLKRVQRARSSDPMKRFLVIASALTCFSVAVLMVAGEDEGEEDVQFIQGFTVPDYDDQMNLKSKLHGDYANIHPNGIVDIKNLMIEFFNKEKVNMRVTAPQCTYDRRNKKASSERTVRIAREDMVVTGKGFAWNSDKERFVISTNVKVVLRNVRSNMKSGD